MKILLYIILILITSSGFAQENLEIKRIRIKHDKAIHNSFIKEQMSLESTSWFKRKILKKEPILFSNKQYQKDIRRVIEEYQKKGYLKISVEQPIIEVNRKNKIKLIIKVNEGSPIRVANVNYTVDSSIQLKEALPNKEYKNITLQSQLTESKSFTDQSMYEDQLLISNGFSNIGYPFNKVDFDLEVDTVNQKVNINWFIEKGKLAHFGPTIIIGNQKVPNKSIYRQLAYDLGDIWSKKKIDQTQKQIYGQGMYRVVSVRTIINEEKTDTVPMQIQIKEAPRWTTRFGVGYGREDKFRAFADVTLLGFITKTGRINVYGKHSGLEPYNFYLRFSQPSVFFPINTLSLYPYIQSKNEPGYHLEKTGFNISFLQNFSKQLNTSIGYQFEDVRLDSSNIIMPVSTVTNPESFYKKAGFVLGGIYTTADPLLDPVQGHAISLNFKTNGLILKNDIPFYRILAEYKKYIGIQNGIIVAFKAKIGGIQRIDNISFIPADERFYAGGSNSVRGWARSELGPKDAEGVPYGGNSILEGSLEARFLAGKKFIISVFCDGGNVWRNSFSYNLNDLRYSAGTGIKIKTPIGPAGIDFARPIFDSETSWQLHFSIGHSF